MKHLLLTSAFVLGLSVPAFAGAYTAPMTAPEVIIEDTVASGYDILVPIIALIMFAAAASD